MTREPKMDVLHPRELLDLVAQSRPPCVSLYLPTHRRAPASREDALGLRRLLDDARTDLGEIGLRRAEIDDLFGPASSLLTDRRFWEQQADGLAILLAADRWQCLRLPFPVPELVTVGERFSIHPLLELLAARDFFVLALSHRLARLFTADPWSIRELEVDGLAGGVLEGLPIDEHEESLQVHGAVAGPRAEAAFHGHGGAKDAAAAARVRYLRALDRTLHPILGARTGPLVVAGVASIVAEFTALTRHGPVLGSIAGNPDRTPPRELHAAAWAAVEPHFLENRDRALQRYAALAGTGRTSDRLVEIVEAASRGRVETLLLAPATAPGGMDPTGAVEEAIAATLLHRGEFQLIAEDSTSDLTLPAAILRP
jgi:hypothetical protein